MADEGESSSDELQSSNNDVRSVFVNFFLSFV